MLSTAPAFLALAVLAPAQEPGLALRCAKALTCAADAPVVDNAIVLVKDGKIEAVGSAADLDVPDGYREIDVGDLWVMPGMIDLHCHIGGEAQMAAEQLGALLPSQEVELVYGGQPLYHYIASIE